MIALALVPAWCACALGWAYWVFVHKITGGLR